VRSRIPDGAAGVHWDLIRAAFSSDAVWAIVPLQDVLGLGDEARMNTPGVSTGNWSWRVLDASLTGEVRNQLYDAAAEAGRIRRQDL
jgi:4-alpha-glucanotransferase